MHPSIPIIEKERIVADLDLEKLSGAMARVLGNLVHTFLGVLLHLTIALSQLTEGAQLGGVVLQRAIAFSMLSLVAGMCLGYVVSLAGTPRVTNIEHILGTFLLVTLASVGVHFALRVIGGSGPVLRTVCVTLYVVGTLQLIWIPIVGMLAGHMHHTEVTLTYPYVIAYGDTPEHSETFVQEEASEMAATIAVPAERQDDFSVRRTPKKDSQLPAPIRMDIRRPTAITGLILLAYTVMTLIYFSLGIGPAMGLPVRGVLGLGLILPVIPSLVLVAFLFPSVAIGSLVLLIGTLGLRYWRIRGFAEVETILLWWAFGSAFACTIHAILSTWPAMFRALSTFTVADYSSTTSGLEGSLGEGLAIAVVVTPVSWALLIFLRWIARRWGARWSVPMTAMIYLLAVLPFSFAVASVLQFGHFFSHDHLVLVLHTIVPAWAGVFLPQWMFPRLALQPLPQPEPA